MIHYIILHYLKSLLLKRFHSLIPVGLFACGPFKPHLISRLHRVFRRDKPRDLNDFKLFSPYVLENVIKTKKKRVINIFCYVFHKSDDEA
jgi:hypothetical protein